MSRSSSLEWRPLEAGLVAAGLPLSQELSGRAVSRLSAADVQCLIIPAEETPSRPGVWTRLPIEIAALMAPPESGAAIVASDPESDLSRSVWEFVLNAVDAGGLRVDAELHVPSPSEVPLLPLSPTSSAPIPSWRDERIQQLPQRLARKTTSEADVIALQAGLWQMADQLDASHEASQSIEGAGRRRAGDYWHAIHHRRERDYGNAKYWFRRVGPHPVLERLGERSAAIAREFNVSSDPMVTDLVSGRRHDAMRFVDLAESVDRGQARTLRPFAEALQWAEMVLLLEQTWQDASTR